MGNNEIELERQRRDGIEARQALDSPALKRAIERVEARLEGRALACSDTNASEAIAIIQAKQQLKAIVQELEREIASGGLADRMLEERESKAQTTFRR